MAGTVRFHTKHHGKLHHTKVTPGYFDSAVDPIAGPGNEFMGDFHLSGCFVTYDTLTPNTSAILCSNDFLKILDATSTIATNSAAWTGGSKWTESGNYTYLSDTNNYVGIGTTTPETQLHVEEGDSGPAWFILRAKDTSAELVLDIGSSANRAKIWKSASAGLHFRSHASGTHMTIEPGGDVGIGTAVPGRKLHVAGTAGDGRIKVSNSGAESSTVIDMANDDADTEFGIYAGAADAFQIWHGTTGAAAARMTIETGGNVGIGTDSPGEKLDVAGAIAITGSISVGTTTEPRIAQNAGDLYLQPDTDKGIYLVDHDGSPLLVAKDGGNVGIGTSSPNDLQSHYAGPFLTIKGTNDAGVFLQEGGSTQQASIAMRDALYIQCAGHATNTANNIIFRTSATNSDQGGINRMTVNFAGNVGIGTDAPAAKFEVASSSSDGILIRSAAGNNDAFLSFYSSTNPRWSIRSNALDSGGGPGNSLVFVPGTDSDANTVMAITSAGNVGIGTTAPSDTLTVIGTMSAEQAAKAWCQFGGAGDPPNVRQSHNVASITDNAVGQYYVNFTNPVDNMSSNNDNYCVVATAGDNTPFSQMDHIVTCGSDTTSRCYVSVYDASGTANVDPDKLQVIVFGG